MARPGITVDRLAATAAPIELIDVDAFTIGHGGEPAREPHRHDYHELLWTRAGSGQHVLDGQPLAVQPGTITLIGRGQVHVFERARDVSGAVVRFGEELLHAGPGERPLPTWLFSSCRGRVVAVPRGDVPPLEATLATLQHEIERPVDRCAPELERHLLTVLLLWVERWYDDSRTERRDADDADIDLHRRFAALLEREYARHQDAAFYADALRVPAKALSKTLTELTGRSTKELVLDRVMLEAARLLRYTELTVGQVAAEVGFRDQLYFSRAFRRHHGLSPSAFRDRARGRPPTRDPIP
jgi:AraC family transcriptional activator of pobA